MQGCQIYLRRSAALAIELFDAVEILGGQWLFKSNAGGPSNRRTQAGKDHVSATDFFFRCADFRARLAEDARVQNLRHLLA